MSDLTSNPLRNRLKRGEALKIAGTTLGNAFAAEIMASMGFDAIWVDMQHADLSLTNLSDVIRGVRCQGVPSIVRVAENNAATVHRVLDSGTFTVISPFISSVEDCEKFVDACFYKPRGSRSWGPFLTTTAMDMTADAYFNACAEEVLPIAMLETVEAVEQAEAIMSVPGLGGIYIGTSDLSVELGLGCIPDVNHPILRKHIAHIFDIGKKLGVPAGAYAPTIDGTRSLHDMGAQFLWMGADHSFMRYQSAAVLKAYTS